MATPPQPDVSVDIATKDGKQQVDVVLSRDNKAKSYQGVGSHNAEAVKDVVRKILDDPSTAEYVKRG